MRVLIFGALKGGIGLAKYISTQNPVQYKLVGFISHEPRIKDMKLLGVNVYTMDDDLAAIIQKEKIQAVLVSPLRIEDFRENQAIQDILIGAGVKIIFAQGSKEAVLKNGDIEELTEIAKKFDDMATVRKMKEIVPEYKSNNSVYEVLDK